MTTFGVHAGLQNISMPELRGLWRRIEELGFDQFWKRKTEVLAALEEHRQEKGYSFAALLVTDVVLQGSLLLISGAKALVDQVDYPKLEPGIFQLDGVVSRKKQLLPYLTHALAQVKG